MWVEAGTVEEIKRARKKVVDVGGTPVVLVWHESEVYALDDICIHKQRELHKGVVLHGRLVCPGHQWAYELDSGYCRERDRYQPTHAVRVEDGVVWVGAQSTTAGSDAEADGPEATEEVTWLRTSS